MGNKTSIINLGGVRDLLAEWTKVREAIVKGQIRGFSTALMTDDGGETIYLGGAYKQDPQKALSAMLKTSAARTLTEEEPLPKFKASQM